jgi:c-di-GMP-binding flagellar brake protein YcgR
MGQEDNLESFAVTSRREICFYLRQLINDGERVTVSFDEGRDTLLTVLLDVNEETGKLYFDWGGSEMANQRLMKSRRNFFVASPRGVRHQFMIDDVNEGSYRNRPAFVAPLPEKLVRLQRRDFFRMALPMTQRPPCRFSYGEPPKDWAMSVVDIGIGGVALEAATDKLPFSNGETIKKVSIDLGKAFGVLVIDLEVRFVGAMTRGKNQVGKLGCAFIDLKQSQDNLIQKFITRVQQEERARLG